MKCALINFLQYITKTLKEYFFSYIQCLSTLTYFSVSETLDDFKRRVGLSKKEVMSLRTVLKAVAQGDEKTLERMGMPSRAWDEVNFFMTKLIKSGFAS